MKLWQQGDASSRATNADTLARFCTADDLAADHLLVPFDIRASIAHVRGLARIGVLTERDATALTCALAELGEDFAAGRFVVDDRFEDGHTAIEWALTERLGDVGRRVHAGRSRNDQVQVALRLYAKERVQTLVDRLTATARTLLARAGATRDVVMPGYTHLQRAVPSTVGMWLAGFAEGLVDDVELAGATLGWLDASPLGTGAGHGVSLPLDREGVARELGFARVSFNPICVQNARGKVELAVLGAFEAALLDARRFAWDVSLFVMQELGFVALPDAYTTGSSLMPNKRNPDVVELLRAAYAQVAGARVEIASTLSLPSGYHRDLQRTKASFVRAVEAGLLALSVFSDVARDVEFVAPRMRDAIDPAMYMTDRALALVAEGVPFRDAYLRVKERGAGTTDLETPEASVQARRSPGACADLRLDAIAARLDGLAERVR